MLSFGMPQPITWDVRETVEKCRALCGHSLSSHAFVSLYLWKTAMGLSIVSADTFFAVKSELYGPNTWFFPCGREAEVAAFLKAHQNEPDFHLVFLRDEDVTFLQAHFPGVWRVSPTPDADEYIASVAEYTALSGSAFAEIRRKMRRIEDNHAIDVLPLEETTLSAALSVVTAWQSTTHAASAEGLTDDEVAQCALMHWQDIGLSGVVVYIDGVPMSVFAGFPLCADTVDVLIGKCTPEAPKGLAYFALHEYVVRCCGAFTYCNHEEDLGLPGIRQMKSSLCPCFKNRTSEAFLI